MILLDVGLTLLGGPQLSPSSFICDLLSLPRYAKQAVSDIVFARCFPNADGLVDHLSVVFEMNISDIQRTALVDYWNNQLSACHPLPGAEEFCDEIIRHQFPYCIASNLWKPFHMALTRFLPDIERKSQHLFLSYMLGARKPSREFYDSVYSTISVPRQDVIIVGDSFENDIAPCMARGSTCIMLDQFGTADNSRLKARLAELPDGNLYIAKNHRECLAVLKSII